jgi:glutamate-1-semialdehyde 2,1-aminomutase
MQELLRRGVIAPSLVVSYSHSLDDIELTIAAFGAAFQTYRRALEDGPESFLLGRSVSPVFRRYA